MGLFEKIFGSKEPIGKGGGYFQTLTAYSPVFSSWNGELYESELVRAAIDANARHASKLKVEFIGAARPDLRRKMNHAPNAFQTWGQFLYRTMTILMMQNTAFIVPVKDEESMGGFYTVLPTRCEVVQYNGEPWIRYNLSTGQVAAVPMAECGVLTRFQYKSDFFGETNRALSPTMSVVDLQNQAIKEAVSSGATFRFSAQLSNFAKAEDIAKERKRFNSTQLSKDGGGILLFPNTYSNIQQLKPNNFTVETEQMNFIKSNVFNYFGVNEEVLQNKAYGDAWSAFYEGSIEPFAIQLSDVLTKMTYTQREQTQGSQVIATSNRLQYLSNTEKLNVSAQMADRGIMSVNEIREIWNLSPVEGGDERVIRGEYKAAEEATNGD